MDEYKAQIETYGTSEAQQPDQPSQPDEINLPSADSTSPSLATGGGGNGPPHVHGGPNKIAGIQKSAADAQAERERVQQNREMQGEGCDIGGDGQSQDTSQVGKGSVTRNDENDSAQRRAHPYFRGGPAKIAAISKTLAGAEESSGQSGETNEPSEGQEDDGPDIVDGPDGPVRTKPIPGLKLRGGPKKINAVLESARNAQAERMRAANETKNQD